MSQSPNHAANDPYAVYEIADGIFWTGFADRKAGFSNNPYLVVTGEEAVLIDPGSVLHYHIVAKKVLQIVRAEQIKAIIVQHQDPDLCASVSKFEVLINRPIQVIAHPLTSRFLPYYGIESPVIEVEDRQSLRVAGRTFEFHCTPYVHFAGAIMTWDPSTRTLFASDVFAALTTKWSLYAGPDYADAMRRFVEPYVGSDAAWKAALSRVRSLKPDRICPQHGSVIEHDIDELLDAAEQFEVARSLDS